LTILSSLVFVFIIGLFDSIEAISESIVAAAESGGSCVVKDILVNKDSVYVQSTNRSWVAGNEYHPFVSSAWLKLSGLNHLRGPLIERRGEPAEGKKSNATVAPQQIGSTVSYIYYRKIDSNSQITDVNFTEISDSQQWSMRGNKRLLHVASMDPRYTPESIGSNPQRQREDGNKYGRDRSQPFGGYLGEQRNPLKDDTVFGGAFIIGGSIFFVLMAFGIRELIAGRDEDRYMISHSQEQEECANDERYPAESKSSTKPR
jgi:hypothetical protein